MIEEWKQQLVLNLVRMAVLGAAVSLVLNYVGGIANLLTQTISLIFLLTNVIFLLLPGHLQKQFQRFILYMATAMMLAYWIYALYINQQEFTRISIMFGIGLAYPLIFGLEFILSPAFRALKESVAKILLIAAITLPFAIMTRNSSEALTGFSVLVISLTIHAGFLVILYSFARLETQLSQAKVQNQNLSNLAFFDTLTGIPNRHSAEAMLAQAIATTQSTFSVVLIDLDHFKKVNDTHGHLTGDRVLQQFSTFVKRKLRGPDMVARWGGEEFLLIALDTDTPGCLAITERLQEDMKQVVFPIPELTFSGGIATYQPGDTLESLIERADHALYQAKSSGRNRLRFWGPVNLNISYTQH